MRLGRREMLRSVAGGLLAAGGLTGLCGAAAEVPERPESRSEDLGDPYPLREQVRRFLESQESALSGFQETGITRRDYLNLAEGIVSFFARYQDDRGAILDPYEQRERQYATPAFACAGAILHATGHTLGLLSRTMKAMDAATADLRAGAAADHHEDFYTSLLMHAYLALKDVAPSERTKAWAANLAAIDPLKVYRDALRPPQKTEAHNWNVVALSGEFLRHQAGLGAEDGFVQRHLAYQMRWLTPFGMYRDPNCPMAYDHFPRFYLADLLEHGYRGPLHPRLDDLMDRGAWTSLFLQSPCGELPCGGRSAHHQWNEAEQILTYELYARRYMARGEPRKAGAFRRAAHLAAQSIQRWVRPSGELWIVKNRYDPRLRWGYEGYSFHSQYNLLTAAKLAISALHAADSIREAPCPAEVGGFVVPFLEDFHKVVANAGGLYLEIDTRADGHYNPSGLIRVHRTGVSPLIGPSDGVIKTASYQLPRRPSQSLALGPAWRTGDGAWHSLADYTHTSAHRARVRVLRESPRRVEFEVVYEGSFDGVTRVTERYRLTPEAVQVTDTLEGEADRMRQVFPLLAFDGERETRIRVTGHRAEVSLERSLQTFESDAKAAMHRLAVREPFRNGEMDAAVAEVEGRQARFTVRPRRA